MNRLHVFIIMFITVLAAVSLTSAEEPSAQTGNPPVVGIVIKGLRKISEEEVRKRISIKVGEPYNVMATDRDFTNLWNFRAPDKPNPYPFIDISINPVPAEGGVVVEYTFRERPFIDKINWEYLDDGKPAEQHYLKPHNYEDLPRLAGTPYVESAISTAVQAIKKSYHKRGFHEVKVDAQITPSTGEPESYPSKTDISFVITEGSRQIVKRVRIEGNTAYSDKELLNFMQSDNIKQVYTDGVDMEGWLLYQNELAEFLEIYYRSAGFLDAKAVVHEPYMYRQRKNLSLWELVLEIKEGPRYRIGNLTFDGNKYLTGKQLVEALPLDKLPYYSEDMETAIRKIIAQRYGNDGRIFSDVAVTRPFNDDHTVDLNFKIYEDNVRKIHLIEPRGNRITRDDVIRRQFALKPGETYDTRLLNRTMKNLANTRFFKNVIPRPFPVGDDQVDLMFDLEEGSFGAFSIAGSYISDQGFVGELKLRWDNFDLFAPKKGFRGGGQRFELSLDNGVYDQIKLEFAEPYFLNQPLTFTFSAYDTTLSAGREWTEDRTGVEISLNKRISLNQYERQYFVSGLSFKRLDVGISDIDATVDPFHPIYSELGLHTICLIGGNLELDFIDRPQLPTSGWRTRVWGELADNVLGGEKEFYRYGVDTSVFIPLFKDSRGAPNVLSLHAEAKWADSFGDTATVPVYEKFYAGGVFDVRGYRYRSLGPRFPDDPTGDPVGGKFYLVGNLEVLIPIQPEHFIGVLFCDTGNVWDSASDFDPTDMRTSIGFGFRIEPLGVIPISLFWSRPLNPESGDELDRFSISLGTFFF